MSRFPIFDSVRIVPRNDQFLDRRVGSAGEIYFDDATNSLRLYNGSTLGGQGVALDDLSNIANEDFLAKANAAGLSGGAGGNTTVTVGDTLPPGPAAGNLWFNTNTGTLFLYYDDGDSRQWVQPSSVIGTPASATDGSVFVGTIAPISPENGDLWLNTSNGSLYVYVNDGDSSQWIQPSVPVPDIPSGLSAVALSGSYTDLSNRPTLFSGNYNDLTNRPALSTVATTGDYNDLINKPIAGDSIGNLTISASTVTTSDAAITFSSALVVNNSITFNSSISGFNLSKLSDVDVESVAPTTGQVLKYNGTRWVAANDATTGGGGTDADTLDGFDGDYYLNYSNFTGNVLDTTDSSAFTFVPAVNFDASVTIDNSLTVNGSINGDLSQATGLPISTGVSGLGNNVAAFLQTPSSTNLSSAMTDKTGTGSLVFSSSPTLSTPNLGTPSTINLTNGTNLPVSGLTSVVSAVQTALTGTPTGTGNFVLNSSPSLTTPNLGTPSSGNLSNCTADGTNPVGLRITPINTQSANYTLVLTDSARTILHPSTDNNARTFTIPANASVAFPVGTTVTFVNRINSLTIAITTDTLRLANSTSTGSRTLGVNGVATCIKIGTAEWIISGNGLS